MGKIQELERVPSEMESIFDRAGREGEVFVKSADGRVYAIRAVGEMKSPLDVPRVPMGLTKDEIVQIIREGRQRVWDPEIKAYREGPWPGDDDEEQAQ